MVDPDSRARTLWNCCTPAQSQRLLRSTPAVKEVCQSSGRSSENFGGARLGKRTSFEGGGMAASVAAARTKDEFETENGVVAAAGSGGVGKLAGLSRRS